MMQMRIILNISTESVKRLSVPTVEQLVPPRPTAKRLRIFLGTFIAIEAAARSPSVAETALEAAFAAIAAVDRRMHPQSAGSELAKINEAPLHSPVFVHGSVLELLRLAYQLNTLTGGVFDPCLPAQTGRLQDIEISSDHVVCHAPVAVDFGGYAKGYAVDCAVEALMSNGCAAGLVNAGGDLRVFGPRSEPVLLRGPGSELTPIEISDTSLAVSDADSKRHPAQHRGYYVKERGDELVERYAAVIAKRAVIADALTKCVLLCPRSVSERVLVEFGATRATVGSGGL
jgi:thiamine biosynthesis lipoprotein